MVSKVVFENGGSASSVARENERHFRFKNNQFRWISRIWWSSVDGRKRCKKASVDEKLFIPFQETENGGFRKHISVDRAKVVT